jgi:catechol 2,3-dioxygenase-like lactoylglutathione lyase family enzyme
MKFRYVTLFVADVSRAQSFYQAAFGLETAFVHESGQYAELATGDTKLALSAHTLARDVVGIAYAEASRDRPPPPVEVSFGVDDVRAAHARAVAAGAVSVKPPTRMPWGQTVAYLRDGDGVLVGLVEGD